MSEERVNLIRTILASEDCYTDIYPRVPLSLVRDLLAERDYLLAEVERLRAQET